jgi:hypothetical protein
MKQNQGIAHLASIFVLPVLVISIFYAPIWLKIILVFILIAAAIYLWQNIIKK